MPKRARLLAALASGEEITAKQIVQRYGYASEGSARKILSNLRFKGIPVHRVYVQRKPARAKYRLGMATQTVAGAGHRELAAARDPSRISVTRR